ncbi:SMI1/KNR4 family protein [Gorillibacterium sp. CAU 1737]|uniref:SMI1/KNR4 family protein n=1 Tax=Gorillibacterium sp. CAU 1737 TaxID=3140362 RepID=UPI00326063E6
MNPTLLEQLNHWNEEDEHQQIVDTLLALPEEDWDYEAISLLGRAYNNLQQYEEALALFHEIADAGQKDPLWHYRMGYAYYHMQRYEEAAKAFARSGELEPGDPDTDLFVEWSLRKAEKQRKQAERLAARKAAGSASHGSSAEGPPFSDAFLSSFWKESDYAQNSYQSEPPTDDLISSIEEELGYKLPASYIALMKHQNGGIPCNTNFPTEEATSWAEDHIAITGILGIGREKRYSLCGDLGSSLMIEEWGYPDIGVVICNCPSAGHDVVMLDYRACGPDGEPEVIHVDQEGDYEITFLAENFEAFIKGLVNDEVFDTSAEDKEADLHKVAHGAFSPLLAELCANATEVESLEQKIRTICTQVVEEKGHFSFHADERSYLMYDVQFWLYTKSYPDTDRAKYLDIYKDMIAFGGEFGQRGYAPSWITSWLDQRMEEGRIIQDHGKLRFTDQAVSELLQQLENF